MREGWDKGIESGPSSAITDVSSLEKERRRHIQLEPLVNAGINVLLDVHREGYIYHQYLR